MTDEVPGAAAMVVHATAFVVGETGVLVRGASGAGKSRLAREVIAAAIGEGRFARLVADDRVALGVHSSRVVARPVPPIEGLIEIRGVGLASMPYEPAALLGLVVDLQEEPLRLPERPDGLARLGPVEVSRIVVNFPSAPSVVLWRLGVQSDVLVTVP